MGVHALITPELMKQFLYAKLIVCHQNNYLIGIEFKKNNKFRIAVNELTPKHRLTALLHAIDNFLTLLTINE